MSSVDTRLQKYWNFAMCLHKTGASSWLTFLQNMATSGTGISQQAAIKLLARRTKDKHESHTG